MFPSFLKIPAAYAGKRCGAVREEEQDETAGNENPKSTLDAFQDFASH